MLSDRTIKAAKADPSKDIRIADGDGLYLKVARGGTKTFTYRYTYAGKRREVTLGTYPVMGLADAREARIEQQKILDSGRDPVHVKATEKHAKLSALTVEQLVEEFHDKRLVLDFEQPGEARDLLKKNVVKKIGKLLVPDVTKQDITTTINAIVQRGAKVMANRVLTLTRKMFQYAVDQHYIEESPVTMTRRAAGGRERSKTTNLSFEQIQRVLQLMEPTCREHRISWQTRAAMRLILATGKRPGEVVTLEWKHLNLERKQWINPKHLTKEKREDHLVFLSRYAVNLLREVQAVSGKGRFVFPSDKTRNGQEVHIARHSVSAAINDLHHAGILKFKFTPHDMRRTFSSRMADLGIMPHVVEKILDHLMEGVMAVYNRASYLQDRYVAMDIWGEKLEMLMGIEPAPAPAERKVWESVAPD